MDISSIKDRIKEIKKYKNSDPEKAHNLRDGLYLDVLISIANKEKLTAQEYEELAKEALKAQQIKI